MPLPRIAHKRRIVQGVLVAALLLLPFASVSGNPFLRMDIAEMTLFLAGVPIRIDQFYLLLLVILLIMAFFLLVTALLGRVWCGWLCPQTVLNDLMDFFGRKLRVSTSAAAARLTEHFFALVISKLVAFNLFCWFMPPRRVLTDLLDFPAHPFMLALFLALTLCGYLNLVLVRRSFCRSYCPYGRLQTALMDAGTLSLEFPDENRERCLRCGGCVKVCPMGIDIRSGFQIECIACGRCIDICRAVMEDFPDGAGLIEYRFRSANGTGFRPGTTAIMLLLATLLFAVLLGWGISIRGKSSFAVQRVATAEPRRLADGSVASAWRATIGNRSETAQIYSIRLGLDKSGTAELLGQIRDIRIAPNQHQDVTFMIRSAKPSPAPLRIELQLLMGDSMAASVTVAP